MHISGHAARLQPVESYESVGNSASGFIALSCLNWGTQRAPDALIYNVCPAFDVAQNNGNLLAKAEYVGGPAAAATLKGFGQNFSYDGVNRLTGVDDSGYTRSFGYDQWGNMWVSGCSVLAPAGNAPTANVYSNNRINGTSYDTAGNQSVVNGNNVAYDAENRKVSVTEPPSTGGSTESYLYDGNGQRVQKTGPGSTTTYVYDTFGRLTAEYAWATSTPPCGTCYLSYDHLGSVRMVTDQNGNVVARHDFLPFGEEILANTAGRGSQFGPGNDNVSQKFTGKERDSETGEDFFQARYISGALGRFTSPDPSNLSVDFSLPQTWNR